jgi:formate dehydrogenase assembly factor FdhD
VNDLSLSRSKLCKYNCGQLLSWDTEEGYFVEVENNNAQHTRERCEGLRGSTGTGSSAPSAAQHTVQQQPRTEVKQAVNQDLIMAVLQELREHTKLLRAIAGVEA